jgi:hypothetical protein
MAAVSLAMAPSLALASAGARVGPARIALSRAASPGGDYALEPLYVANSGTESATFGIRVDRLSPSRRRPVPRGWVVLGTSHVDLEPGQAVRIPVSLHVPPDAAGGDYLTNVVATTGGTVRGEATGAAIGAGAAADLVFSVEGNPDPGWFVWPVGAVTMLIGLAALVLHSSGYRLRLSRRSPRSSGGRIQ